MHFHIGPGVAKLVRCSRGRIVDVIVDLRRGSPTYAQWEAVELDDEHMRALYVPVGFAHGFCVLSDVADVLYKQTAYYDPAVERGIAWDDPDVAIAVAHGDRADRLRPRRRRPHAARARRRAAVRVRALSWQTSRNARRSSANACASAPTATPSRPANTSLLAYVALGALTLIVLTGAAVRLTGSGLGCPTWPKCYGNLYPPLKTHALIEFSNRLITVPVCLAAGLAWVGALRRRPYRRDLTWLAALLPLGVIGQAVLGGLTVRGKLDYGWVMGHFALSMLILVAAAALAWRAAHEPERAPPRRRSHARVVGPRARRRSAR